MSGASPLWSPQQREWLQALGHPSLKLVDRRAVVSAEPPLPDPPLAAGPAEPSRASAAADALTPVPTPPEDALQRALLRATRLPAAEAGKLLQSLDADSAALRADPAAKRLLWSRLRRLRGVHSP